MTKLIQNIPTHLFLGFLGVGKTSAILSCFKQKPNNEHWVVVVNEFGKQGIDGKIYADKNIQVKEVPGGCLCCAAGLPFQQAILHILKQQKPDRLFIESSGASHADGVIKTLAQDSFKGALDLKAKVCLIDPNHLIDKRYFNNINYQAQINAADVLIANKIDLASEQALSQLDAVINSFKPAKSWVQKTSFAQIDLHCLHAAVIDTVSNTQQKPSTYFFAKEQPIAFKTFGWNFAKNDHFNLKQLSKWLQQTGLIRAKGIINSAQGWHSLNTVNGLNHYSIINNQLSARIEIIVDKNTHLSNIILQKQLLSYIEKR